MKDELSACEVRVKTVKKDLGDAYDGESIEKNGVKNSVKGRTQIEEDENGE